MIEALARSILLGFVLGGLLSTCSCGPKPRPVDPRVGAGCEEACARGVELDCEEPVTPRVGTCEEACHNYERNGGDFCTDFLAGAKDCSEFRQVAEQGCTR